MRRLTILVAVLVAAGCRRAPDPGPPPVAWSDDVPAAADGNNRFAVDLYGKLAENPGNVLLSPFSAHAALAMTATGAAGNTRDRMAKVLHLPAGPDGPSAAGDLGRYPAHPRKDYELAVANALWGRAGFPWRDPWLAVVNDRFGGGFRPADFASNPDAERDRINAWVADQTRGKVRDLLRPEQVTPQTTMVLTNAVYFKGTWVTKFDPAQTRDGPFHRASGGTVTVPLMSTRAKCRYTAFGDRHSDRDRVRVVELPYRGDELAMVLIVPALPGGLPAVERKLTADFLAGVLADLKPAELSVTLPRFKVERRYELLDPLKDLGLLAGGSDFSGMADAAVGDIDTVTHQAVVEVNEEGTEAAAAAVVIAEESADPDSLPLVADHPFLFLIRDVRYGTVLFMGRVSNPKG
ncbi:MAG: serpin family protein [Gemmataceae bacterium]|nr:serpin family protein [Gemmataceae bacterium]